MTGLSRLTRRRRPRSAGGRVVRAGVASILAGLSLSLTTAAAAVAPCDLPDVDVLEPVGADDRIPGVRVAGAGPECDGLPATVTMYGNPNGDFAEPATRLSVTYSNVDPCTGSAVPSNMIIDGAVTVGFCLDEGAPSPAVTAFELLAILVEVPDQGPDLGVEVLGEGVTNGGGAGDGGPDLGVEVLDSQLDRSGGLADTGAPAMMLVVLGLLLLAVGETMRRGGARWGARL